MKFNPAELGLFENKTEVDFKIMEAEDYVTKSNPEKEQLKLKLFCRNSTGKNGAITVFVPEWKIKQFCASIGIMDRFEAGHVDPKDCKDKWGRAILGIEKSTDPKWGDKNIVLKYLAQADSLKKESEDFFQDGFPHERF